MLRYSVKGSVSHVVLTALAVTAPLIHRWSFVSLPFRGGIPRLPDVVFRLDHLHECHLPQSQPRHRSRNGGRFFCPFTLSFPRRGRRGTGTSNRYSSDDANLAPGRFRRRFQRGSQLCPGHACPQGPGDACHAGIGGQAEAGAAAAVSVSGTDHCQARHLDLQAGRDAADRLARRR